MSPVKFEHDVEGLAHPVMVTAEFDEPDYSVGHSGGWFLAEAELQVPAAELKRNSYLKGFKIGREEFRLWFGDEALQVVEDAAADQQEYRRQEAACSIDSFDRAIAGIRAVVEVGQ